ncbi:MAG: helix-turn-helix domain-containing protein [Syntrophobacteraceae bacterium]
METVFSIKEAAEKSKLSVAWWRMQVYRKKIKYLKIGRRVLIPESTLRDLIEASTVNPRQQVPSRGEK